MLLLYHAYMGNSETSQINYEVIQDYLKNKHQINDNTILINTLSPNNQDCVIYSTTDPDKEEQIINELLEKRSPVTRIILYGKNCRDATVAKKIEQFKLLGLLSRGVRIQVYSGGLFEWLLLQEIYSEELFPTTGTNKTVDLLKYK